MKNPISDYLRKIGGNGGKARAKNLGKKALHDIAMKGVEARRRKKALTKPCG